MTFLFLDIPKTTRCCRNQQKTLKWNTGGEMKEWIWSLCVTHLIWNGTVWCNVYFLLLGKRSWVWQYWPFLVWNKQADDIFTGRVNISYFPVNVMMSQRTEKKMHVVFQKMVWTCIPKPVQIAITIPGWQRITEILIPSPQTCRMWPNHNCRFC